MDAALDAGNLPIGVLSSPRSWARSGWWEDGRSPAAGVVGGTRQRNGEGVAEGELRVTVELGPADGWPIVRVAGEVDIQTSPALEDQLRSVVDQGHASVLVDLGEVTFLDSTGLSALIGGLRRCQAAGGELRLVSPRPNVRKVLEITGLTDAFHLEAGEEGGPG